MDYPVEGLSQDQPIRLIMTVLPLISQMKKQAGEVQ